MRVEDFRSVKRGIFPKKKGPFLLHWRANPLAWLSGNAPALYVQRLDAAAFVHPKIRSEKRNLESSVIIRSETESDIGAISEVTRAAFKNHPISNQTEQFIVHALRGANALTISLVAEIEGKVVGHIAFSPVAISDGSRNWYGIGPLSVLPEYQGQGIGKSLMNEGLARVKALGAEGCALAGDPVYYERFGFRSLPELTHEGVPQEHFLVLPFDGKQARGVVVFHQGFLATS